MTPYIYVLPHKINLLFLRGLYYEIVKLIGDKVIVLDWSNVEKVETGAITYYLCLQNYCCSNDITIQHAHKENLCYQRIENIMKIDYLNPHFLQDIYIVPAKNEAETHMIKGIVKQFFENSVEGITKKLETQGIETMFSELFMNICQHSQDTNGFIFIPAVTIDGQFEMVASDLGVGIVQNIRNYFSGTIFENDESVIEYATKNLITTASTRQNQGKGLNTILTSVKFLKGRLTIFCEKGHLQMENDIVSLKPLALSHKGTFLHISFNINQLDEKEETDYEDFSL